MSEFGTGYAYCLGLFLCHDERQRRYKENNSASGPSLWFYGAADHLFEMEIPWFLPAKQKRIAREFRARCLDFRHESLRAATWLDVDWAIQTAKDLLRMFDATLLIKSERGDFE